MRDVAAGRAKASTLARAPTATRRARVRARYVDRLRRRRPAPCARSSTCRWRTSTSTSPGWWSTCCVNERGLAKLPKVSVQYCEPERPCTLVIGPKNHRRWEISLKPGEDPQRGGDAGRHLAAALALARRRGRHALAPGQLSLPCAGGRALAQGPRVPRRRRRAHAAAVPGPGHVPGHPRRGQPRLEARCRAARRSRRARRPKRCSTATASSARRTCAS